MVGTTAPRTEVLLDALVELFLAEGFRDANLSVLASRLRCSKSTLYAIAPSKEQLIVAVVRAFFRRSTDRIEEVTAAAAPGDRLRTYLLAIAEQLAPASPAFFADLEAFAPARELYERNTGIATARVRELLEQSAADPLFAGVVAGLVMEAINAGTVHRATGLDDASAYRALADLIERKS